MKSLFFWKHFSNPTQVVYLSLLSVFFLSLIGYCIAYFIGYAAVINWQTNTTLEALPITIDSFSRGLFTFRVEAESMFIKEMFQASEVKVNLWAANLYFAFLIIAYIVALAVITALSRVWYYVGMLVFIFLIATQNLDLLRLFNQSNSYPIAVIIGLYCVLSYYFFSFNKNVALHYRIIAIAALTAVLASVIYWQKAEIFPVLIVTNLGMIMPIFITIICMIINSFEVILVFLNVTASNTGSFDKSRLRNFVIISGLYLGNLILFLCKKMGFIDWDILYLNMFLLFLISLLLGIWGYRKRGVLNNKVLPFAPLGALLYLCYGIIAISTIAYAFITANQPLIDAFEYAILLSHVGFGFLFFMYVLINFGFLFKSNISIYQVVYVPRRFPFFTVHTGGGLLVMSLFFKLNMYPYFLGLSGYANATADYYQATGDKLLAKEYYLNAVGYSRYNQRSNYSLATLYELEENQAEAQEYYGGALNKNTTAYTYVNLANWYLKNDMLLQAMFTLKDGYKAFPQNGYIANNLALLFAQTNIKDSTYYYLQSASETLRGTNVATSNFIYQLAKDQAYSVSDSIAQHYENKKDLKYQNNTIALLNFLQKPYTAVLPAIVSIDSISPFEYAVILNKNINEIVAHKITVSSELDTLLKRRGNDGYSNGLLLMKALKLYYGNNKQEGIDALQALYHATTNAHYAKMLGIWYYEQEAYMQAYEYFKYTIELNGQEGVLNCCMALCEANKYSEAQDNLTQLALSKSSSMVSLATTLIRIFEAKNVIEITDWNQSIKYQFIHFRKNDFPIENLIALTDKMDTAFYKNISKAELINTYIERGNSTEALRLWESITDIPAENTFEKGMLNLTHLKLLNQLKNWKQIEKLLPNIYLNSDQRNTLAYWNAKVTENSFTPQSAKKEYLEAIRSAPMNANVVIDATKFIAKNNTTEAYELLTKAVKQNNQSEKLLKAYIEFALQLDFSTYAEDALQRLSLLMPSKDFDIYKTQLLSKQTLKIQ